MWVVVQGAPPIGQRADTISFLAGDLACEQPDSNRIWRVSLGANDALAAKADLCCQYQIWAMPT